MFLEMNFLKSGLPWVFIVCGFLVILSVNIRGGYHKDKKPKWYVRVPWTVAGACFIYLGIHRLL
jgi:hypothetical protein